MTSADAPSRERRYEEQATAQGEPRRERHVARWEGDVERLRPCGVNHAAAGLRREAAHRVVVVADRLELRGVAARQGGAVDYMIRADGGEGRCAWGGEHD